MTDRSVVDRLLVANRYLVLGTADADGQPWVTPSLRATRARSAPAAPEDVSAAA
jgi:predicted pyridoxine 5'-phosphate oxidase superfamily flavin-nucleotide-binding protein